MRLVGQRTHCFSSDISVSHSKQNATKAYNQNTFESNHSFWFRFDHFQRRTLIRTMKIQMKNENTLLFFAVVSPCRRRLFEIFPLTSFLMAIFNQFSINTLFRFEQRMASEKKIASSKVIKLDLTWNHRQCNGNERKCWRINRSTSGAKGTNAES